MTAVTIGTRVIQTVSLPASPGFRTRDWTISDKVGGNTSPYTGTSELQAWPGADMLSCTVTLPPMAQKDAMNWTAFLMSLRGRMNGFMLGDALKSSPAGLAGGVPLVDSTISTNNLAMAQQVVTRGWPASVFGTLLPGDALQIGYRLYLCTDRVNSDASGAATFGIFPSLREAVTDATPINLNNPQGLFRLAKNERTWSDDYTQLTRMSFPVEEYR